ncbi:hypothetical protein O8I67_02065 [Streptococcus uberis]|uniref:hypothetical protein n=1 Tax=Streptococcus uberis TaxID=1349 RepID=UPI0022B8AEA2|nr:hypothetical protein [Streptococcus uberis]MCZ8465841.1 hypothetical protein [Streptococcus uberis]
MVEYSININFGNIWDALSAIGTIGAVIVSLWLALPNKFQLGKIILQGVDEPLHLVTSNSVKRYIGFDFINNSDFEYEINSVNILIDPKISPKNSLKKNKLKYKSKYKILVTNNMESVGKLPLKINPKDIGNIYYNYDIFFNELIEKCNNQEILFCLRTNTGKYFYSKKFCFKK